jgi:glycerophosphoryl diester phosphodiesterase
MGDHGSVIRPALAAIAAIAALALVLPASAGAQSNPWLSQRILNFAHQGGEFERPSNTMFAFERAYAGGADVLEMDIHTTSDGEVVVIHDSTVDRTTNATGSVYDMTLADLQKLDAGYNFVPGRNAVRGEAASAYPYRGVRTGAKPPPAGHTADDFRVPTLKEVFAAFPDVPINIEIKGRSDGDAQSFLHNAEALAAFLNKAGRTDVIVVSFHDEAIDRFHMLAPQIPIAPGLAKVAAYFQTGAPLGDGYVALQVPPNFQGIQVMSPEFVARAHRDGYAVHTWIDSSDENAAFYDSLIAMCADAIMTAYSDRLERVLRQRGYARPGIGGLDPCGPDSPQIGPCTLRARSPAQATADSLLLRVRRKDRWRDTCRGSAVVTSGATTIARGKIAVGPGPATQTMRLPLKSPGRRLIRRNRRLKADSVLRAKTASAPAMREVTIRAP